MNRREAIELLKPLSDVVFALDLAIEALGQTEIVRCKDCKHYNPPHIECNDGTRKDYPDGLVPMDIGINVGGKCENSTTTMRTYCIAHDRENPDDFEELVIFRQPMEYCSFGEKAEKHQLFGETSTTSKTETVDTPTNTPTCNHTCNQKQFTSKLETAETATSEGEESTTSQPKSKLDCISRQQAIDELKEVPFILHYNCNMEQDELVDTIVEQIRGCTKRMIESLPPVTPTEQNEEDVLKFYYVESLDEYWIGQRCGTRYYGKWTGKCFTFGYSRYLPWGEHVVAPGTLWKEHTYPSEPKEIPFNEWLKGFLEKECQTERTGEWEYEPSNGVNRCSVCGTGFRNGFCIRNVEAFSFCPNCGAKMKGGTENE